MIPNIDSSVGTLESFFIPTRTTHPYQCPIISQCLSYRIIENVQEQHWILHSLPTNPIICFYIYISKIQSHLKASWACFQNLLCIECDFLMILKCFHLSRNSTKMAIKSTKIMLQTNIGKWNHAQKSKAKFLAKIGPKL